MKTLTAQDVHALLKSGQIDKARRGGVSQHFTWHEVLGSIRPSEVDEVTLGMLNNAVKMAGDMEKARAYWKRAMRVTSWLRVPSHNARIGGAEDSWHMTGLAVDWQFTNGTLPTVEEYRKYRIWWQGGLGINRAKGFVHNDKGADRDVPY